MWAEVARLNAGLSSRELCPSLEDGASREAVVAVAQHLLDGPLNQAALAFEFMPYARRLNLAHELEEIVAGVMGTLWVVSEEALARKLLARAQQVIPLYAHSDAFGVAHEEPALFALLVRGRWLLRNNLGKRAVAIGAQLSKAQHPALRQAGQLLIGNGEQVARAPRLFDVLGCGTVLYGTSEQQLNGRYLKTQYWALWYIPLFPLARYEVSDIPNGWRFHARVPFSMRQHMWRWLWAVLPVAAVVGYWLHRSNVTG